MWQIPSILFLFAIGTKKGEGLLFHDCGYHLFLHPPQAADECRHVDGFNNPLAFNSQLIICSYIFRFKEIDFLEIIFGLFPTADMKCYPSVPE